MKSIKIPSCRSADKGEKLNTGCYVSAILEPLVAWRKAQATRPERKLMVHTNKAKPQTAKVTLTFLEQSSLKNASHLAPSDFFLLLAMSKDCSQDNHFQVWMNFSSQDSRS
jgi:hypothetical protein